MSVDVYFFFCFDCCKILCYINIVYIIIVGAFYLSLKINILFSILDFALLLSLYKMQLRAFFKIEIRLAQITYRLVGGIQMRGKE